MGSYIFTIIMLVIIACLKFYFPKIKGAIGENRINNLLKALEPDKYFTLHDLYIPKENGQTTQIDHIVLSPQGIFVIETKNYTGWIMGSENSQYWTQVIYKRKEKMYNPIWQNSGHIKALKAYLNDFTETVPIHSIIVFTGDASLKFKEPFKQAKVVMKKDLLKTIRGTNSNVSISPIVLKKLYSKLTQFKIEDPKQKKQVAKQHVKDIKEDIKLNKIKVQQDICPRCGGNLVTRNGKNGLFRGCSHFPTCRYTSNR